MHWDNDQLLKIVGPLAFSECMMSCLRVCFSIDDVESNFDSNTHFIDF